MIPKRDLGRLELIDQGAIGVVYRLSDFRLAGHGPLAYKELKQPDSHLTSQKRHQALEAMIRSVAFRAALGRADRDDLDAYTTWPLEMVEAEGTPCGCLMPLIPPEFFLTTRPSAGIPKELVFQLSWLSAKDSQAQRVGVDRSGLRDPLVRIALLAQLVYAIGRLHKHGVVYGDVSLKNAALALDPPRIRLLDCDAAAALSDVNRVQLHSSFFTPPEFAADKNRLQDQRSDIYKLGLCIIRGLQQGEGMTQAKDPAGLVGRLDAPAVQLIARAVGADPDGRPTAKELFTCLERNLRSKAAPPALHAVQLSRHALPRGTDVEVRWVATGADDHRIQGPNGLDIVLSDTGADPVRTTVTPSASGEITVEVRNSHGSAKAVAGEVQLFDLPPFQLDLQGRLPRPAIAALPHVRLPAAGHAFPPIPTVSTAAHRPAQIALPPLTPITDAASAVRGIASPLERLAGIHAAATEVGATVRSTLDPSLSEVPLGPAAEEVAAAARIVLDDVWWRLRGVIDQELQATPQRRAGAS